MAFQESKSPNRGKKHIEILQAYGLNPKIMNGYQLRIFEDGNNNYYDWYHTTGSLCRRNGKKVAVCKNAEDVAIFITEF